MSHTAPTKSPTLRLGRTTAINHFKTSGERSARQLPTEIQTKLAACQRRNGRTCWDSQRISEGIHEIMQFRGLKTTNSSSAEEQQRSARKGRHSILLLVCSQTRQLRVISPPLLRIVQSVRRFRVRKWDRQRIKVFWQS